MVRVNQDGSLLASCSNDQVSMLFKNAHVTGEVIVASYVQSFEKSYQDTFINL